VVSVVAVMVVGLIVILVWLRIRRKNATGDRNELLFSSEVANAPPTLDFCDYETTESLSQTQTETETRAALGISLI
jgi:hypothetical protein